MKEVNPMVIITVEAEIRPTEIERKVKQAILNVFTPDHIEIEERGNIKIIVAKSYSLSSLQNLHRLLRTQRILDAARSIMEKGIRGNTLTFHLNKQAALQGKISFTEAYGESPMGPITVTIEDINPREVIDWLAPKTSHGKPLWEREMPKG